MFILLFYDRVEPIFFQKLENPYNLRYYYHAYTDLFHTFRSTSKTNIMGISDLYMSIGLKRNLSHFGEYGESCKIR